MCARGGAEDARQVGLVHQDVAPQVADLPQALVRRPERELGGENVPSSSQRNGIDTGARGSARGEYGVASVLPRVFWLWSRKTLPRRFSTDHSIVVSCGC